MWRQSEIKFFNVRSWTIVWCRTLWKTGLPFATICTNKVDKLVSGLIELKQFSSSLGNFRNNIVGGIRIWPQKVNCPVLKWNCPSNRSDTKSPQRMFAKCSLQQERRKKWSQCNKDENEWINTTWALIFSFVVVILRRFPVSRSSCRRLFSFVQLTFVLACVRQAWAYFKILLLGN